MIPSFLAGTRSMQYRKNNRTGWRSRPGSLHYTLGMDAKEVLQIHRNILKTWKKGGSIEFRRTSVPKHYTEEPVKVNQKEKPKSTEEN